jgi:hypothetical protein
MGLRAAIMLRVGFAAAGERSIMAAGVRREGR